MPHKIGSPVMLGRHRPDQSWCPKGYPQSWCPKGYPPIAVLRRATEAEVSALDLSRTTDA